MLLFRRYILRSGKEVKKMKHNLKISISKKPRYDGIVTCRNITLRERFLRLLFGAKCKVTILIPGDSVEELAVSEIKEGGNGYGEN